MRKELVYIAGALRGNGAVDYLNNVKRMTQFGHEIKKLGVAVYVPCHDLVEGITCGGQFEDFFENSAEILRRCDCMVVMPNWEKSEGVKKEIRICWHKQPYPIPIFYGQYEFMQHLKETKGNL